MKNSKTQAAILDYLSTNYQARVEDMYRELGFSKSILHRYLKKLTESGAIQRIGEPPKVYYSLAQVDDSNTDNLIKDSSQIEPNIQEVIDENYLYTSASGVVFRGLPGFKQWIKDKKLENDQNIAKEYFEAINYAKSYLNQDGYIDATEKLNQTFADNVIKKVFYSDFYSLPKFGKTKLGHLVVNAKQSQDIKLIKELSGIVKLTILNIINKFNIEAIGFIPHSIPRKLQFLNELKKQLNLDVSYVNIDKIFPGKVIVAQKSLPNLEQRIKNAKQTIFIPNKGYVFERVLLIDDLVGSGATVNETAKKIINMGIAKEVYVYALVGSYKGFEVVPAL